MNQKTLALLVGSTILLAGCGFGESRFNPLNWFPESVSEAPVEGEVLIRTADPRPLIPTVTSLVIEETPGGAIVRAVGLPPTQGWHTAALVSETRGRPVDGVLTFAFRALPPIDAPPTSTVQSREIVVGRFVSELILAETREIRVVGETNTRSSRR